MVRAETREPRVPPGPLAQVEPEEPREHMAKRDLVDRRERLDQL